MITWSFNAVVGEASAIVLVEMRTSLPEALQRLPKVLVAFLEFLHQLHAVSQLHFYLLFEVAALLLLDFLQFLDLLLKVGLGGVDEDGHSEDLKLSHLALLVEFLDLGEETGGFFGLLLGDLVEDVVVGAVEAADDAHAVVEVGALLAGVEFQYLFVALASLVEKILVFITDPQVNQRV